MKYKYTNEWLASVDRSSTDFLIYCEGRSLARIGLTQGALGIKEYLKVVTDKRGSEAAVALKQLGHDIFLQEGQSVLKPIHSPPCNKKRADFELVASV